MSSPLTYYQYVRREIEALLPEKTDTVLEIGCGAGSTLEWLKSSGRSSQVYGVEIQPAAAAEARKKLDMVFEGNIELIEPEIAEESVDLILCLDVFEHLVDPWKVAARLNRFMKPGGHIIASIPNIRHKQVLFPLVLKERWDYVDEGILDRTHLRFFVRETAIDLIRSGGFTVDRVHALGLGKSERSKRFNSMLPSVLRSLFEKQYLIRGRKQL